MARLIDADSFSNEFNSAIYNKLREEYLNSTADDKTKDIANFVTTDIMIVFNSLIDNAQPVEPEITEKQAITKIINSGWLVKHDKELRDKWKRPQGEWIKKVDDVGFISHICSRCGAEIELEDPSDNKFCWNCGAPMGGKNGLSLQENNRNS